MNIRDPQPMGAPGYRLLRWIGASGTASLYTAMELSSGRMAAVKIFHLVDGEGLAQLERLLRACAALSHPNIVPVLEIGHTADGRLFHSMPLLRSLDSAQRDLIGSPFKVAVLLRGLLDGLGYAHRCGMVHGGIKPSNVLFDEQGRAQLADFGIARCMVELGRLRPDAARYLSPEQARGDPPGPPSDVYGLGMLAYELLTGASPVRPRKAIASVPDQASQPVPRLPPASVAWQLWMDRALVSAPERRFQNTREMAGALEAIVSATSGYGGGRPVARTRRSGDVPKWTWSAAVAVLIAATLAAWALRDGQRAAPAADEAPVPAAASAESPALQATVALPIAAAPPAPSAPVTADTSSLLAARVQGLIATADNLRAQGRLFSPPFHNAASHYLAALAFDPGNPSATAGIDAMLAMLRDQLNKTWNGNQGIDAVQKLRQGDELTEYASASAQRAWRDYRSHLARHVGGALVQAVQANDAAKIAALQPLAKALPAKFPAGFDFAAAKRAASTPPVAAAPAATDALRPGARLRDPHGPLLVYVPAAGDGRAFAIARVEVTRSDYAAFVRATHRPAARCLAAHNPFSRLRHLSWRAPGFEQGSNDPAVCVSWDDAAAYAAWLSKTTGQRYVLPDSGEWLRAARGMPKESPCKLGNVDDVSRPGRLDIDRWPCDDGAAQTAPVGRYAASAVGAYDMYGNVSEWVAGGSPGSRPFRGVSWRSGSHEGPLGSHGTADADVGYTSVGFRVMRVIDSAHPAPPPASGR